MKKIALKGKYGIGKFTTVSDEDFEFLSKFSWRLHKTGYVVSSKWIMGKMTYLRIHRMLFSDIKNNQYIDHINHNRLDNRRENLRICTRSQNQANKIKQNGTTSIFKGVSWNSERKHWRVFIQKDRKNYYIGSFKSELKAGTEYNKFAIKMFGEFALLNPIT